MYRKKNRLKVLEIAIVSIIRERITTKAKLNFPIMVWSTLKKKETISNAHLGKPLGKKRREKNTRLSFVVRTISESRKHYRKSH